MSEEEKEKESECRAESFRKKREAKSKTIDRVIENIESRLDQEVLEALNLKDQLNLAEEYAALCAMPGRDTFADYKEKAAFARWLASPAHLRNPKTIEEAANLAIVHNLNHLLTVEGDMGAWKHLFKLI